MGEVRNALREVRQERGLSQQELADRAGVARQTVSGIEAGRYLPSVTVALRLARALGCTVENLFDLATPQEPVTARLARVEGTEVSALPPGALRVALAELRGRWVAHPLLPAHGASAFQPAAGVTLPSIAGSDGTTVAVRPLRRLEELRSTVVVAGCDPAIGLLAAWLADRAASCRVAWVHAPSRRALAALVGGDAHVAGLHLYDEATATYNVPAVRSTCGEMPMLLVHLASWEQGLILAPGNPLGIRGVDDLADPRVRLVNREPGSGAREQLDRLLRRHGIPPQAVVGYERCVAGHLASGWAVATGAADVGLGTRPVAEAFGLDFLPLSVERFDLVLPVNLAGDPRVAALLDALASPGFRAQLASLGGYDSRDTGHVDTFAERV